MGYEGRMDFKEMPKGKTLRYNDLVRFRNGRTKIYMSLKWWYSFWSTIFLGLQIKVEKSRPYLSDGCELLNQCNFITKTRVELR